MPSLLARLAAVHPRVYLILALLLAWIVERRNTETQNPASFGTTPQRMTSLQQLLVDVDDALVSESNPARTDGSLDYERCAVLHNYLVAYGWMAYHEREDPQDLNELLRRPSFFEQREQYHEQYPDDEEIFYAFSDRLDDSLISFLGLIITTEKEGLFYWVEDVAVRSAKDSFLDEENNLVDKDRFVLLYGSRVEFGSHTLGIIYDQQRHRATLTAAIELVDCVSPVDEHLDMWYPLETILSHWIHLIRIGKVTAGPEKEWGENPYNTQLGAWTWHSYSPAQVDSTVAAMDQLSAAIEARMPRGSLLSVDNINTPLLTDADLDAASVPDKCFIRSFLTRIRTPRFKYIAPGLEIPHDSQAFVARQRFTQLPPKEPPEMEEEGGTVIPSVLIFATADSRRTAIGFNKEIRETFVTHNSQAKNQLYDDNHPIPTGLYSERAELDSLEVSEDGFRLLLPFAVRPDWENRLGPKNSDGSHVSPGSVTGLFQHGFFPMGGEWRAQRLERLLDRWRELVESGVWTVGYEGVQGGIEKFLDAAGSSWRDYWIPPGW